MNRSAANRHDEHPTSLEAEGNWWARPDADDRPRVSLACNLACNHQDRRGLEPPRRIPLLVPSSRLRPPSVLFSRPSDIFWSNAESRVIMRVRERILHGVVPSSLSACDSWNSWNYHCGELELKHVHRGFSSRESSSVKCRVRTISLLQIQCIWYLKSINYIFYRCILKTICKKILITLPPYFFASWFLRD